MNPIPSQFPDSSDIYSPEEAEATAARETVEASAPLPVSTSVFAETRRTFSKVGLAYLVLVAALLTLSYAIQYALLFTAPWLLREWWMSWVLSLLPLYGGALPLAWLILRRIPVAPHNPDFTHRGVTEDKPSFGFGKFLILLIIAFGCMTAGGLVGNIVMSLLSAIMDYDYANGLADIVSESPVWVTFIGTCICAPLGEELLFRKLLIDRTRRFGDLPSILLSGLLFGLFHGNLFQFFYAAAVGMLLAYLYTRTGKYWLCVIMHAAINLMGSIVMPNLAALLPEDMVSFTNLLQPLIFLFVLLWQYGVLVAGIVLFCVFFSRRRLSRGTTPMYRENGASLMFLNVGMIACLAAMALLMAVNLIPIR